MNFDFLAPSYLKNGGGWATKVTIKSIPTSKYSTS